MSHRKKLILPLLLFAIIAVLSTGCSNPVSITSYPSGDHTGSIYWDGANRTYIIHIPPGSDSTKSMPLVICLHGGGGTADDMVKLTHGGFNTLADRDGFIAIYPSAIDGKWNDGRDEQFSQSDDIGFISELINQLIQTYNVDSTRVYVTGISNGSQMTMCLARELSDQIAAVAPVCYSMSEKSAVLPVATKPISVLVMTGTNDPLIPWEGGETLDPEGERLLGPILSVRETIDTLIAFDNCAAKPDVTWVADNDPQDGTRVRVETYGGGSQGIEVVLYAIIGGGHTWPIGWQYKSAIVVGKTCRDIDADEVIWSFFQKHSR